MEQGTSVRRCDQLWPLAKWRVFPPAAAVDASAMCDGPQGSFCRSPRPLGVATESQTPTCLVSPRPFGRSVGACNALRHRPGQVPASAGATATASPLWRWQQPKEGWPWSIRDDWCQSGCVVRYGMVRPRVLVVAGTHGNEINGPWLLDQWRRHPALIDSKGLEVQLAIGNPAAFAGQALPRQRSQPFLPPGPSRDCISV